MTGRVSSTGFDVRLVVLRVRELLAEAARAPPLPSHPSWVKLSVPATAKLPWRAPEVLDRGRQQELIVRAGEPAQAQAKSKPRLRFMSAKPVSIIFRWRAETRRSRIA